MISATVSCVREQVARACRILALEGYTDLTLGHASARADDPYTIYIKRKGPGLDEVCPDDIVAVDLRDPDGLSASDLHLETAMHTEVYRARADVGGVIHGHPPFATALGATGAGLEFLTHDAALFADGLPVFDETPSLILTWWVVEPSRMRALGGHRALLLRNHGALIAGRDLRWAVLTAVTLERHSPPDDRGISGVLARFLQTWADRILPVKYQEVSRQYWSAWIRRVRRSPGQGELGEVRNRDRADAERCAGAGGGRPE